MSRNSKKHEIGLFGQESLYLLERRKKMIKQLVKLGWVAGTFLFISIIYLTPGVMAQEIYPAKDITYICGSNPGGGFDTFARGMSPFFAKQVKDVVPGAKGGEIKVKNMAGGGRAKAVIYMHEDAKPDGYTISDFNRADMYKFIYGSEKLPFDIKNFTWVAAFTKTLRVVVSKKNGPKTWAEMIASTKKQPPIIASSTVGSSEHLETIWFKEVVGLPGKITSTGGSSVTVGALIRGDADLALMDYAAIRTLIDSGEVNFLVSITHERLVPNVPTIIEVGYPKCLDFIGGKGRNIIGPPKLDPKVKATIIAIFKKMVADPEFQAWCEKTGNELAPVYDKEQEAEMMKYVNAILANIQVFQKYGL